MPAQPDARWVNVVGWMDDDGVHPMSFEVLEGLAVEWADFVPDELASTGASALLRTSRSLFAHAWFDYEFMAVACLVGFQALEAAFRQLYPEASVKASLMRLVRRAQDEELIPANMADLAITGVELRNLMSHPASQAGYSVGMAAGMLENTHRLVALVTATAIARDKEGP